MSEASRRGPPAPPSAASPDGAPGAPAWASAGPGVRRYAGPPERAAQALRMGRLVAIARSGLFDPAHWRLTRPDLAGGEVELLAQFYDGAWKDGGQPNPYFDPLWYARCNPDVVAGGLDPLYHYAFHGDAEGRRAGPLFDSAWYRSRYGVPAGTTALAHYLAHRLHGRVSPLPEFELDHYLAQSPELAGGGVDPFEHFWRIGWRQGRSPSPALDLGSYARRYMRDSPHANPFGHWLERRHKLGPFLGLSGGAPAPAPAAPAAASPAEDLRPLARLLEGGGRPGPAEARLLAELAQRFPPVPLPRAAAPLLSVVIPTHGRFELTHDCLAALAANPPRRPFEVIVVDDASADATALAGRLLGDAVRVVRAADNVGFLRAANLGAAAARGRFLLFLNNDTLPKAGALDALVATAEADPALGVVGARLLNADGTLQESGGIVWRDGSAWNWGRGQPADHPRFAFLRPADYVSGAALLTPADLFRRLGGFDEHFAPAYYEDTDYCFRVRAAGLGVAVQPAAAIVHLEGQSHGTDPGSGGKRHQETNRLRFAARWAQALAAHAPNGERPEQEAERGVARRVLFLDEAAPTPDRDAGSVAALSHIRALQRLGWKVVFLPAEAMARSEPHVAELQRLGVEVWHVPYAWSVEDYLTRHSPGFELVYVHRRRNLERWGPVLRRLLPGVPVVFSVADLHGLREMRQAEALGRPEAERDAAAARLAEEVALAEGAEATIVHSDHEAAMLRRASRRVRVARVPWAVPVAARVPGFAARADIGFVGSFAHPPNLDAVEWFAGQVWPLVLPALPDARFVVVGSGMPVRFAALGHPRVVAEGHVPDLEARLAALRLTVAPLRFGAGVKGKVLASLAAGVPCAMTPVAAEGLGLDGILAEAVAGTPEGLAALVRRIHGDAAFWAALSEAGRGFVARRHGEAVVDAALAEAIALACRPRRTPRAAAGPQAGPRVAPRRRR